MSLSKPTSILRGTLFTVVMRWTDRLIGVISTLILARLLVPEDFGIIAMASIFIGLVGVFLDVGVHVALIQNKNPLQSHYNAAWTIRLGQVLLSASFVFFSAPFAADYYGDARVVPVMQWMALGLFIAGFENIGTINFQKEMRFGLDFQFMFFKRIASFIITITAAFIIENYWALVIGTLVGRIVGVILSYWLHPMRPRLSLEKFGEIFGISQWMLVSSIGGYLDNNLHKFIVGRQADSSTMGAYTLGDEISGLPTSELLAPLNRVLFPAMVQVKHDRTELKRLFLLLQSVQTTIAIPVSIGLALIASDVVAVLLGEKWFVVVPFLQILAIVHSINAITTSCGYILLTLGWVRYSATIAWLQVVCFIVIAFLLLPESNAVEIAVARVISVLVGLSVVFTLLLRVMKNIKLWEIIRSISRPVIATIVMALSIFWIKTVIVLSPFFSLVTEIIVGAFVYVFALGSIWLLFGRPAGAESYFTDKLIVLRRENN
jgi:O-antigen/teichoic acid export membrane protein